MHSVCVDSGSVVIVDFDVIGGAMAIRPPRRNGCRRHRWSTRWGWIFDRGEEDNGPDGAMAAGAADNRYLAEGLINAIAFRWRTNLGNFG